MAPKSLELDTYIQSDYTPCISSNLPPQFSQHVIKFGIPEKYISLNISERERSFILLQEINSYYDELVSIYEQYPELATNIYFNPHRFKCLKEYLVFLEDKHLSIRKYKINCKHRKLLFEINV